MVKKLCISYWEWDDGPEKTIFKKIVKSVECPTIKDFSSEIWDYFHLRMKEEAYQVFFWTSSHFNPHKPNDAVYDGSILGIVRDQLIIFA